MNKVFLSALLMISIISCKKNDIEKKDDLNTKKDTVEVSGGGTNYSSTPFTDIFKSVDYATLDASLSSGDSSKQLSVINDFNQKVTEAYSDLYGIDLTKEFQGDPYGITILGTFKMASEHFPLEEFDDMPGGDDGIASYVAAPAGFNCFLTAVGAAIGLSDARNIWRSIVSGASEETVIAAVKLIGRRVAAVITVAIMVYQVGDCLDWW